MISPSIQNTIKTTVHSIVPDARVLLFGSMARGDANEDSDYDILVIIPNTIDPYERITMSTKVNNALVDVLRASVDVLVKSEEQVNRKKDIPGNVIRWALKEGVEL